MAQEIKNTFLKSKMNKDLDDRILPNGEYRDALNISVGRSEDNDVGALENIIGNDLVSGTDIGSGLTIIGIYGNNSEDTMYVFLTDYEDLNPSSPTNAPADSKHYIYSYNAASQTYTRLVQGNFLNFSTTNKIVGINIVEGLLFWTDNRNQPRKINVNLARTFEPGGLATIQGDYYTKEHQISVAKYNPYQAIQLYTRVDLTVLAPDAPIPATTTSFRVAEDRFAELSKFIGATVICNETNPTTSGSEYVTVTDVSFQFSPTTGAYTTVTVSTAMTTPTVGQFVSLIKSSMSNESSDPTWPGDPDFLEDKFVRFSYRFKFEDNEYSIMAPFTQIAYIPKQKGFFLNGDEDSAYQSTIVDFMENLVQNIGLVIPLPTSANKIVSDYKISEIDILFRESDAIAVKVLASVDAGTVSGQSGLDNYYTYEYQSRKPYRTLPEAQTVRVYDKVPVRALTQELAGNRIIYGNFRDKHTPPSNINYNCKIGFKSDTGAFNNWIEYPNHSVKRNRNYQVGFVLSDKFGRQSPVLLSSVDAGVEKNGVFYAGSTIYAPYDAESTDTNVLEWFGDTIQVLVNDPISSKIDSASGTPGLYAIKNKYAPNTGEGFAIADWIGTFITNSQYTFRQDGPNGSAYPNNQNIPRVGDYMRGAYTDFVKVTAISGPTGPSQYTVTTDGRVNDVYLRNDSVPSSEPDLKFTYNINDLGWYSYKIVVKQTEQDYYNVYRPGILNGYPGQKEINTNTSGGPFPTDETNLTAHTVLFNDNINKVPRDLAEVGPDQKQFRSSVRLYGRVSNLMAATQGGGPNEEEPGNAQYYPRLYSAGKNAIGHTATTIATASELDMSYNQLSTASVEQNGGLAGNLTFYQIDTDPLIARISTTEKPIGWDATRILNPTPSGSVYTWNMLPYLAVYETEPVESLLDIYWESTSEGLIVDLNAGVASSNTGVAGFQNLTWDFKEDIVQNTFVTGSFFEPVDNQGLPFTLPVQAQLDSVTNAAGDTVGSKFELVAGTLAAGTLGKFKLRYIGDGEVFTSTSAEQEVYSFGITCETADGDVTTVLLAGVPGDFGALENIQPAFGQIAPITKTPSNSVLISAAEWEATNYVNGGAAGLNSQQLRFSFEVLNTGNNDPGNFQMDETTGKLTQRVTNYDQGFEGNALGLYNIRVTLTDANGASNSPVNQEGYSPLSVKQDIQITLEPILVNTGCLTPASDCVVNGTTQGANFPGSIPTQINETQFTQMALSGEALPGGVFGSWRGGYYNQYDTYAACTYYICHGADLTNAQLSTGQGLAQNQSPQNSPYTFKYRIGTEAHKSGVITFTINTFAPYVAGSDQSSFRLPKSYFYYRIPTEATPNPQWAPLYRENEVNEVGQSYPLVLSPMGENTTGPNAGRSYVVDQPVANNGWNAYNYPYTTPVGDNPAFYNGSIFSRVIADVGPNGVWVQTIRAFNFDELAPSPTFTGSIGSQFNGIEYAIQCLDQQQVSPSYTDANTGNGGLVRSYLVADDLHMPTCAPWVLQNAVTANGGPGNLFKYKTSAPTGGPLEYASNLPDFKWARSPYGDYVNELYTTSTGGSIYSPSSESAQYINVLLDTQAIGLSEYTNIPQRSSQPNYLVPLAQNKDLQFAVGFDIETGKKLNSLYVDGVGAISMPSDYTSNYSSFPVALTGTLRVKQNT
jgi:hypothetical protein